MINSPVLRQIQMDRISLNEYSRGILPGFEDIKRRLFLCERSCNTRLPDHYYRRSREYVLSESDGFHEIDSIVELVSSGIAKLASMHLEVRGNKVFVKVHALNDWQTLTTFCSPLLCISAFLWKEKFLKGERGHKELIEFLEKYIIPNSKFTAIASPYIPQLQNILDSGGLLDLHIHLNGSTETDEVWQAYLRHPEAACKEIEKEYTKEKVKEQFEQEGVPVTPNEFYKLLKTAQRIRRGLVNKIFNGIYSPEMPEAIEKTNTRFFLMSGGPAESLLSLDYRHPLRHIFEETAIRYTSDTDLVLEALLYILVMDEIQAAGDKELSGCFHYYLLILGLINHFLVQQLAQKGFDQFQKITLNGMREYSEKTHQRRFCQLHGNELNKLNTLEGRFAPKASPEENQVLLSKIIKGYNEFVEICENKKKASFKLRLVAHFIKTPDKEKLNDLPKLIIRHRDLRCDLWEKAQALSTMLDKKYFREHFCGVDSASNELDAPPEIFSPIYRFLRRNGIKHFTYHAGEDFHHLLGGLRAIFETVNFLELRCGDRIGHGTAAGINPDLWLSVIDKDIFISKGEWLDDLIFAHHLISTNKHICLQVLIPVLENNIEYLSRKVYSHNFSLSSLTQAWLLRKYCPFHILFEYNMVKNHRIWSLDEWIECRKHAIDEETKEVIFRYHTSKFRLLYHKKIKVGARDIFTAENLKLLQNLILKELHQKEIILEVLPTSNIRISFYKDYKDHHIWRWLGINGNKKENSIHTPPLVIGSDDPGIFATNIYNEYCHIYNHLVNVAGFSPGEAMNIINELDRTSKIYAFNI